jgi:hypothetical protein
MWNKPDIKPSIKNKKVVGTDFEHVFICYYDDVFNQWFTEHKFQVLAWTDIPDLPKYDLK